MLQTGYIQLYKNRPGCPGCLVLSETGGSVGHPKAGPESLGGLMARHPLQVASSPDTAPRVPGIIRSSPTSPGVSWRAPGPGLWRLELGASFFPGNSGLKVGAAGWPGLPRHAAPVLSQRLHKAALWASAWLASM